MKIDTVDTVLHKDIITGVLMTCGLVALKLRLKRAHKQIMPLWEHVPS